MTKNRARVRATKELAQTEGIRHPDASYLADHRKLRLPNGTIHDFATGPLRFLGLPGNGQAEIVTDAANAARSKGWLVTITIPGHPRLQAALDEPRTTLIVLNIQRETGTAPHPLVEEIEAGNHRNRNIIILREPKPGEHRKAPDAGRNMFLRAETPDARNAPALNKVELAKARIAFALRYADMHATGADDVTALGVVARDLGRLRTSEADAIAAAARSAFDPIRNGCTVAAHFKAKHEDILGTHLVEVIDSAWHAGRLATGLRDAAATIEADLRIGLIA